MSNSTPLAGCNQLSSSLKERLKKCGRYHQSPGPAGSPVVAHPQRSPSVAGNQEHSTPNRKRLSSSPLRCKIPNKRQILKASDFKDNIAHAVTPLSDNKVKEDKAVDKVEIPVLKVHQSERASPGSSSPSDLSSDAVASTATDDKSDCIDDSGVNKVNDRKVPGFRDVCASTDRKGNPDTGSNLGCTDEEGRQKLLKELQGKQEILRQLKMVQMYRSKNDLTELQVLIDKWRSVVQVALPDLQTELLTEPKPTLTQLIDHLGIEHQLIQFDPEEETFGT